MKNKTSKLLEAKDNKFGDFDEIPKVTLSEECSESEEVFDLDYRCTDYGEAMDFFS